MRAVVILVSALVAATPFVASLWAAAMDRRDGQRSAYPAIFCGVGVLAVVWIGFTAHRLLLSMEGL